MIDRISQGTGNNLFAMLRSIQKDQEEVLPPHYTTPQNLATQTIDTLNVQSPSVSTASSNLMTQNFSSAEREESKYVQATLIGMKANEKMKDQQQNALTSILQQAKMEYENARSSGERYIALKRAEKKIYWHQNDEVFKLAEDTHLKKTREELEKKAQEAASPLDANGNPIESLPIGGSEETPPITTPELSGSNPSPAPDVVAPSTSEISTQLPVESTPSINILV